MTSVLLIAVGLAGALALVVGSELLARAFLRAQGFYARYRPYFCERQEIDSQALPQLPPVANIEINRDGERGGPPPGPGERAWRALAVGGSALECYYLDQPETVTGRIEAILSRPENLRALGVERVHVGNVARSALRVEDVDLLLRRLLPRYPRLDAILLMVGASDLITWVERRMPRFIPQGPLEPSKIFEQHPEGPWGWAPRRMALRRVAEDLNRRWRRPIIQSPAAGRWLLKVRTMRAEAPHILHDVPDATPMLQHFAKHFARLLRTARTKSPRVIVVHQPWLGKNPTPEEQRLMWNYGFGRPYREQVFTYLSPQVIDALLSQLDGVVTTIASELGVEQIDLLPRLERSDRTFYDFMHLTAEGAAQVAAVVAEGILDAVTLSPDSDEDAVTTLLRRSG